MKLRKRKITLAKQSTPNFVRRYSVATFALIFSIFLIKWTYQNHTVKNSLEVTHQEEVVAQKLALKEVPSYRDGSFSELPAHEVVSVVRVIDGDTIIVRFQNGQRDTIRIKGIDTPETKRAKCDEERKLGKIATVRLKELILDKELTLIGKNRDIFDRRLSQIVLPDGTNIGDKMLSEHLAVIWPNNMDWCK